MNDFGTALVFFVAFLAIAYMRSGSVGTIALAIFALVFAGVLVLKIAPHALSRFDSWRHIWEDPYNLGYQQTRAIMCIASGGLFGVGLGLGSPRVIPVYFTDCIFAVICEQFGVIFGILTLVMYVIIIVRGVSTAISARRGFYALIAMGVTAMLGIQTFIIIGGVLKMIPLTGVTMPFVSYGGTSMVSCMGLVGLLQGVYTINQDDLAYDHQMSRAAVDEGAGDM